MSKLSTIDVEKFVITVLTKGIEISNNIYLIELKELWIKRASNEFTLEDKEKMTTLFNEHREEFESILSNFPLSKFLIKELTDEERIN